MYIHIPKNQHLREVMLHYYYIAKKTAAETQCLLVEIYVEHAPSTVICKDWF